jgi:competence protein ComFB
MAEFAMVNKMEMAVQFAIDETLKNQPNICNCQRCRMDITALALNSLPPRYVVSDFGDVMTHLDLESFQWKADVMIAVVHALEVVKKKPRHK